MNQRVAIVTGGTRGIGRAIVLELLEAGARVAFCARALGAEAETLVSEAERRFGPGKAKAFRANVANEADVEALFDRTLDAFDRVDVLVNNAGINRDAMLVYTENDVFDDVVATNLTACFLTMRRAVSEFLAQGEGGRIVSVSSLSQQGATSQAAYAASKGGLIGLTRSVAKEYGHKDIVANLVAVGLVDTDLSRKLPGELRRFLVETAPLRREGTPAEIARVVRYLCSENARYINGETIHATGGLLDVSL